MLFNDAFCWSCIYIIYIGGIYSCWSCIYIIYILLYIIFLAGYNIFYHLINLLFHLIATVSCVNCVHTFRIYFLLAILEHLRKECLWCVTKNAYIF